VSIEDCYQAGYLATVKWRGGDVQPFTEECDSGGPEQPQGFAHPVASPDGETLLALRHGESGPGYVTLGATGSDVSPVPISREDLTIYPSGPSWAPDGETFAFDGDRNEGGRDRAPLWAVQTDGSEQRSITGERETAYDNPSWSPDGKLIAVNASRGGLRTGLWLIRASNGKPVRRIAGTRAFDPDWSPDGRRIVFRTLYRQREIKGGASGGNLYVIDRSGKNRRRLVQREDIAETQPTWSPNGRWIAWVSLDFTGGDVGFDVFPSIWRVRARGGELHELTDLPEPYVEEGEYVPPHLTWVPRPR